jgi:hypothetical protein
MQYLVVNFHYKVITTVMFLVTQNGCITVAWLEGPCYKNATNLLQ